MDLLDPESIARFAVAAKLEFGGHIDLLINNAGMNAVREFVNLSDTFLHEVMAVNCVGPIMLTKALLESLSWSKGTVINVISDAAWRPMRHSLAYNISKAAMDMATKQMARELTKPRGVSFIGVRPGKMADTGMSRYIDAQVCKMRGWTPEQASDYFKAGSVTGLEFPVKAVAEFIVQLSYNATSYMSGACMDIVG
jgi:NAD(P)-dependent dehydrogenase (short-subunit alcohol dehydrogenase family)